MLAAMNLLPSTTTPTPSTIADDPPKVPIPSTTTTTTTSSSASLSSSSSSHSSLEPSTKSLPTHDPSLKPKASILANPHEAPAPSSIRKTSGFKAAFIPSQPGRLAKKKSGVSLGKSFQRSVPLGGDVRHEGAEVLEVDPRGEAASAGDGVVLHGPTTTTTTATTTTPISSTDSASKSSDGSLRSASSSTTSDPFEDDLCSSTSSSVGLAQQHGRSRTDTMSSTTSSVSTNTSSSHSQSQSHSHPCAIRFAPLPVSGRLKRSTSITIGVAARSQLLQSQGAGRNTSYAYQQTPYRNPPGAQSRTASLAAASAASAAKQRDRRAPVKADSPASTAWNGSAGYPNANANGNGNSVTSKPPQPPPHPHTHPNTHPNNHDVIDLGEEISKKAKSAWKKMMGSSSSSTSSSSSGSVAVVGRERSTSTSTISSTSTSNNDNNNNNSVPPPSSSMGKKGQDQDQDGNSASASSSSSSVQTGRMSEEEDLSREGEGEGEGEGGEGEGDKTPRRRPSFPLELSSASTNTNTNPDTDHTSQNDIDIDIHPHLPLSQGSHQDRDHFPGITGETLSSLASEDQGGQPPTAEGGDAGDNVDSGTQTPRANASSGNTSGGIQRRLSTGAFLGGLSLRHMQLDRRRQLGGHPDDDDEFDDEGDEGGCGREGGRGREEVDDSDGGDVDAGVEEARARATGEKKDQDQVEV